MLGWNRFIIVAGGWSVMGMIPVAPLLTLSPAIAAIGVQRWWRMLFVAIWLNIVLFLWAWGEAVRWFCRVSRL